VNTHVTDWLNLDLNEADGACGSLKPGEPIGDGDDQNRRLSAVAINGLEKYWSSSQAKGMYGRRSCESRAFAMASLVASLNLICVFYTRKVTVSQHC
jgi:hypothetical protein